MSNLFQVDVEAVERLLAEANAALVRRCQDLVAALDRMPAILETDDAVRRAEVYARQLKAMVAEIRKAKSSDKAPFAAAGKAVDAFFDAHRKSLDRTLAAVEQALDAARQRALTQAEETRPTDEAPAVTPIALGGERLVITAVGPESPRPSATVAERLPTVWKASFIDRSTLDLEALRDLMTDADMNRLVTRWLNTHGPKPLQGVRWARVVKT